MLQRKITSFLKQWKSNHKNECLLVTGARQVGKTFSIREFGKENYKRFIELNFIENPKLISVFDGSLKPEDIYKKLSLQIGELDLITNDTLFFIDEIQKCPNARTALKFLANDTKYDFIASGSLLGIKLNEIPSIPVGYERQVEMFSLDFEEFLWACGVSAETILYVKKFFENREKVDISINEKMFEYLREYLIIGGMPEAVNTFIETNDFGKVDATLQKLLKSYLSDINNYADKNERLKITQCFNSIPKQLAKENKKFQYKVVTHNGRQRMFENSLDWLINASFASYCSCVSTPLVGLNSFEIDDDFKLYLNDIGLLTAMYGFSFKSQIYNNNLSSTAKGGIYENLIADFLLRKGYKLHYYKFDNNEIDFLIENSNGVIPLEIKSSNNKATSLNSYLKKYKTNIAYKLIDGNIGYSDNILTLPLYMAMFL